MMNDLISIGASLAPMRRSLGISQRDLAARVGTSQQQIARWEATSYRNARLESTAQVAEALGVVSDDLPCVAEAPATYHVTTATPVSDLGQIAARLRSAAETLLDTYRIRRLGVFGSFANGEQTAGSDVDLIAEIEQPDLFLLAGAALYLEDVLGRKVDLVQPHLIRKNLRDRIAGEVVYVWEAR